MIKNILLCSIVAITSYADALFSSRELVCALQEIPEDPKFTYLLFDQHLTTQIFTYYCAKKFLNQANKDLLSHFIDPDSIHFPEKYKNHSIRQEYIKAYDSLMNAVRIAESTQEAFSSSLTIRDAKSVEDRFDKVVKHADKKAFQAREKLIAVVDLVAKIESSSKPINFDLERIMQNLHSAWDPAE